MHATAFSLPVAVKCRQAQPRAQVRARLCGVVCLMHSCMRQLSLFQWLCNADKRSHEPRCVLNCVESYVSCMRQLSLFQWLCNADKRSHEPRCVLDCVGLYVSCTHACDSFLSSSGCAMQTSAAMSPGACSIVWVCMSHALMHATAFSLPVAVQCRQAQP